MNFQKPVKRNIKKSIYRLPLFFIIVIVTQFYCYQYHYDIKIILHFLDNHTLIAPLFFIFLYAMAVLLMLPTLSLNLLAGIYFGPWVGGGLAAFANTLGALFAFLFARKYLGEVSVARVSRYPFLFSLKEIVEKEGWKAVAFARLFPCLPTGPVNFIFGLTKINFYSYIFSSTLFFLPPSFMFSMLGHFMQAWVLKGDHVWHFIKTIDICFIVLSVLILLLPVFLKQNQQLGA